MKRKRNKFKKAQVFLEYSFIVAVIAMVLVVMVIYMERSLQGKLKESVDTVGEEYLAGPTPVSESNYRVSYAEQHKPQAQSYYYASSVLRRSSSGFTYEGERRFAVSTSSTRRNEWGTLKTIGLDESLLNDLEPPKAQRPTDEQAEALQEALSGSAFDPNSRAWQELFESSQGGEPVVGSEATLAADDEARLQEAEGIAENIIDEDYAEASVDLEETARKGLGEE